MTQKAILEALPGFKGAKGGSIRAPGFDRHRLLDDFRGELVQ